MVLSIGGRACGARRGCSDRTSHPAAARRCRRRNVSSTACVSTPVSFGASSSSVSAVSLVMRGDAVFARAADDRSSNRKSARRTGPAASSPHGRSGVGVAVEVAALVEEPFAARVDQHAERIVVLLELVANRSGRRTAVRSCPIAPHERRTNGRRPRRRCPSPCGGRSPGCSACRALSRGPSSVRYNGRAFPRSTRSRRRPCTIGFAAKIVDRGRRWRTRTPLDRGHRPCRNCQRGRVVQHRNADLLQCRGARSRPDVGRRRGCGRPDRPRSVNLAVHLEGLPAQRGLECTPCLLQPQGPQS